VRHYKSGGAWATDTNNEIDNANWNDGTNKAAVTAARWYRSLFILAPNNVIHWVYPDAEYISLNAALSGIPASIPPGLAGFPTSTEVILRGNATAFPAAGGDQWVDARITLGAVTTGSITDHANLSSLNSSSSGHTIDGNIDYLKYAALNMATHTGATLPADPAKGLYLHEPTGRSILYHYDGSNFIPLHSFGTTTIYVDNTDGTDDLDYGGAVDAGAFKTIQFAIDAVPGSNGGNVFIRPNDETYEEDIVIQGKDYTGNFYIQIVGAVSTELSAATATSGSWTTIVKAGAGWGVNAYQDMMVRITGGTGSGQIACIKSNTATTITIAGTWGRSMDWIVTGNGTFVTGVQPDATSIFVVEDWQTRIDGQGGEQATVNILNGQKSVQLKNLRIVPFSNTNHGVNGTNFAYFELNACQIDGNPDAGGNTGRGLRVQFNSFAIATSSDIKRLGAAAGFHADTSSNFLTQSSWIHDNTGGGTDGIIVGRSSSGFVLATEIDNNSTHGIHMSGMAYVELFNSASDRTTITNNGGWGVLGERNSMGAVVSSATFAGNASGTYSPGAASDATFIN
jgi:hypothetical protein